MHGRLEYCADALLVPLRSMLIVSFCTIYLIMEKCFPMEDKLPNSVMGKFMVQIIFSKIDANNILNTWQQKWQLKMTESWTALQLCASVIQLKILGTRIKIQNLV